MKLAIVGIRGIPNSYGGFETLTEYLVKYLGKEIDITVYCSSHDMDTRLKKYKNAHLKYVPITSHGALGIAYDSVSLVKAVINNDKILLLGFGGGFMMPLLKSHRSKIIVNIGGLDWKRSKWSPFAQKIIKKAEALLINNAGQVISDNVGIQNYISQNYNRNSTLISYGGDQAKKIKITPDAIARYGFLKGDYAFTVTRIQPDNNIEMILESFRDKKIMPIVIVGNWQNSKYGRETKRKFENEINLILLEAIYDRDKLDLLRSNCTIYIHGHSAGGTNPSLVEAMYLGLPVLAFSSGYNEYTTENRAVYFSSSQELKKLLINLKSIDIHKIGDSLQEIAERSNRWSIVADDYKNVLLD